MRKDAIDPGFAERAEGVGVSHRGSAICNTFECLLLPQQNAEPCQHVIDPLGVVLLDGLSDRWIGVNPQTRVAMV